MIFIKKYLVMRKLIQAFFIALVMVMMLHGCKSTQKVQREKSDKVKAEAVEPTYKDPYQGKAESELTISEKYIITYRDLAMNEMKRTKIPASIKLAQGILESGNGNSYLAKKANNHFGIKCGSNWRGATIFFDDDEENECFRKYDAPEQSFIDHSDFIVNSARYAALFKLDITDYKAWAHGLKEAGYATRKNYADLVINIIDRHKLNIYDIYLPSVEGDQMITRADEKPDQIFRVNGVNAILAKKNDSYEQIAKRHHSTLTNILSFNDLRENQSLAEGQLVFLAPKKTVARESYHIVKKGDKMWNVSQEYGVRLINLYERNIMKLGDEPVVGEIVYLRQKRTEPIEVVKIAEVKKEDFAFDVSDVEQEEIKEKKVDDPFVERPTVKEKKPDSPIDERSTRVVFEDDDYVVAPDREPLKTIADETKFVKKDDVAFEEVTPLVDMHIVESGESLSSIATNYGVSVSDLRKWNFLETDYIEVGEKLIVRKLDGTSKPIVATPGKQTSGDTIFHVVAEDESFFSISRQYNTTIVDLLALNNLTEYKLNIGQKLLIKLPQVSVASPSVGKDVLSPKPRETSATDRKDVAAPAGSQIHIVEAGETLSAISRKYGVSVARIKESNKLDSDNIAVGQRLIIIGATVVRETGVREQPAATSSRKHIVQSGETLFSIARTHNTTVDKIRRANNLSDDRINVGQELIIP